MCGQLGSAAHTGIAVHWDCSALGLLCRILLVAAAGHSLPLFVFISIRVNLLRKFYILILADVVGLLCVKSCEFQYYFLKNLTLAGYLSVCHVSSGDCEGLLGWVL